MCYVVSEQNGKTKIFSKLFSIILPFDTEVSPPPVMHKFLDLVNL